VKVRIVDLGVDASTDQDGAFAFTDVPPGPHVIELSSRELVTIKTEEVITKGKKKSVKYMVEAKEADVDEEAVVRAPRIKKEVVETRVRTEEAKRVPGTQGDTLKVVQNLPGVGRSAFGSGALIVWGSAPQDTRVNVDGVEIPVLYHVGGMRSTINADLVRSIDLSPGSFGADYGRGLGGLVRIDLLDPGHEGVHGYLAADVMDVSGMVRAAITPNLRLAVSGRQGYLDQTLKAAVSKDVGDFFPIPRYDDYQARVSATLGKDEELSAHRSFIGSIGIQEAGPKFALPTLHGALHAAVCGRFQHCRHAVPGLRPEPAGVEFRRHPPPARHHHLAVRAARLVPTAGHGQDHSFHGPGFPRAQQHL
jgi:hypothetical protein